MNIIKLNLGILAMSAVMNVQAHEGHHNESALSLQSNAQSIASTPKEVAPNHHVSNNVKQESSVQKHLTHDHAKEHGGQVYSTTKLKTNWMNFNNQDQWNNNVDIWMGTDEQKIAFKAHSSKTEGETVNWDTALFYRYAISTFWDVQAGIKYGEHGKKSDTGVVFGLHGLAPQFFETDANIYISDDKISLNLEAERDFVITQQWIAQPYAEIDWAVYQQGNGYKGDRQELSELKVGLQNRYEINKHVMPFVDVAYQYESEGNNHRTDGVAYGAGIRFMF